MEAAGVELLADLDRLAVMGFAEVLVNLPWFVGLRRRVHRCLREERIDLVLLVDYPGFNLRLARYAHGLGLPVLYYIAPQVWAWKEGRSRILAETCERVLTVLPFEAERLRPHGVRAEFVGHPLLDDDVRGAERAEVAGTEEGSGDAIVGIFPGSRAQEVERILPVFADAARELGRHRPGLAFLVARAPTLPPELYAACGLPTASAAETRTRAAAAMTKSGTVTLELALAEVPMVVGYRTSRLTWALARRVVHVPSIALVNLVAGAPLVPELLQDELTPEGVIDALEPLLEPGSAERETMLRGFEEVRRRLGEPGCAARVARRALELLA